MPKCSTCRKNVPNKSDLALVRNQQGRWVVLCPSCVTASREGEKRASPRPLHGDESGDGAAAEKPLRIPRALKARRLEETRATFQKIQEILRDINTQKTNMERTHAREHERRTADMTVKFKLQRDTTIFAGRVRDISEGGLRFTTGKELAPGQVILVDVKAGMVGTDTTMLQSAAEVRRVLPVADGLFEVGVRFMQRIRANEENRRRYRRYRVSMAAYYTRAGSEYTVKGRALDISQGGARLMLDEPLNPGEEFALVLRGEGRNPLRADLYGRARARRVKQLARGDYEVGCEFVEIRARASQRD